MSTDEQFYADADEARAHARTAFASAIERAIALASDQPGHSLKFSVSRYPIKVLDHAQPRIGFELVPVFAEAELAFLIDQLAKTTSGLPNAKIKDGQSGPMVRLTYPLVEPDSFWDTRFRVQYRLLTRFSTSIGDTRVLILDSFTPVIVLK